MKQVSKKSVDQAVNKLLIKAYKEQVDLAWDRAEAIQPQCGFARMALCCTECQSGPCRVSPFGEEEQRSICGRNAADLVAAALLRQAGEGTRALMQIAQDFGAELPISALSPVILGDTLCSFDDAAEQLLALSQSSSLALSAIRKVQVAADPAEVSVNLGALKADQANVLVFGHVPPAAVAELENAACTRPVNLVAMAGNEGNGLPVVTNYVSQETPLLTGAVDLLVVGKQCVMPSTLKLARELSIPVVYANQLRQSAEAEAAICQAMEHFSQRSGKAVAIPPVKETLIGSYTAAGCTALLRQAAEACMEGKLRGVVYLGGCGSIGKTQDAGLIKLAQDMITAGFLLVSSGCAATALAKAGLCRPGTAHPLQDVLSQGTPAVLSIGSCHDAGEFLAFAEALVSIGIPVLAVMPELTHHKTIATALAFASQGIEVFADLEWVSLNEQVADLLSNGLRVKGLGKLQAAAAALAEVAVTR